MSNQMDHDRISELLSGYVRDDLSADEKRAVTTHLETCSDCRQELAGLRELIGGEIAKLDDFERRRIHAAVAEAIEPKEEPVDESFGVWTPPRRRQGLMARLAPTMGVAALLILLAVGAFTLGGSGSDEESASSGGSGDVEQERGGLRAEDQQSGGEGGEEPAPESAPQASSGDELTDASGGNTFRGPKPKFEFDRAGLDESFEAKNAGDDLAGYVRRNVFAPYSEAYSVRDAERNEATFLSLISRKAPAGLRRQVRACGDQVRGLTEEPILSAYGTVTDFDARRSLLLGFVYTEASRGKLSDYMLWAWPKGSCEERLGYTDGSVDR